MLCQLPHWLTHNVLCFCWKSGIGSLGIRLPLAFNAKCLRITPAEPHFWIGFFEAWIEVFDLRFFRNQRFLMFVGQYVVVYFGGAPKSDTSINCPPRKADSCATKPGIM